MTERVRPRQTLWSSPTGAGSGFTRKSRTVRAVVEIPVPALDRVLQEGDRLLPVDDLAFERADLRPHDRLCRRLGRCHGRHDLGQRKPDPPQFQHGARLLQSTVVVDAVTVAIAPHRERPGVFPVPKDVGIDPELRGRFSDRLHHARLAFMPT